jgi:hypothetical protein
MVSALTKLGTAVNLAHSLVWFPLMLVVNDQHTAAHWLSQSELGPGLKVPFEVSNEGLGRSTARGFDLDQPAFLRVRHQQIGRCGVPEQIVEIHSDESSILENPLDRLDKLSTGAVEQAVSNRASGSRCSPQLVLKLSLLRAVPGL